MNVDDLIAALRKWTPEIEHEYRAQVKGVFGSVVRREERPDSDIDLLVMFEEEADLLDYVRLARELERRLGRRVQIAPLDSIPDAIRKSIREETVYL